MSGGTYKQAFVISVVMCVVLAGTLAYVIRGRVRVAPAIDDANPVVAKGPEVSEQPLGRTLPSSGASVSLAPVQLSPQRMQAIGVKTALAEMRNVSNELRVPGNVEMNERQRAYVQTRFPGWIQKVFANATYQYVRKGQPLFTIYSPDLVSTEQSIYSPSKTSRPLRATCMEWHRTRAIGCFRRLPIVCANLACRRARSPDWSKPARCNMM